MTELAADAPEIQALIEKIGNARGPTLVAALAEATPLLQLTTANVMTKALARGWMAGHVTVDEADAIVRWFTEAWKIDTDRWRSLNSLISGHLDDAIGHAVQEAPEQLPVAKRVLDRLHSMFAADPDAGKRANLSIFLYYTDGYPEEPIPFREHGGVSTTDVLYARLALKLLTDEPDEGLWDFCVNLLTHVPTAAGLPDKVKSVEIDQLTGTRGDLYLRRMFALLQTGLSNDAPETSRVVTADALEQFERQPVEMEQLVAFARAHPLAGKELAVFTGHVTKQERLGSRVAALAGVWAAKAKDKAAAAKLQAALGVKGVEAATLPSASPKDVLLALAAKQWDEARAMLESGIRMNDPGCTPDGAVHLLSKVPNEIRFPLLELLFAQGLAVDDEGSSGNTGLQRAVGNRDYDLAKFLLERGAWVDADMDTSTGHNETPVYVAVENGDERMVKLLLEHGADPTIKSWHDDVPLDIAEDEIKELLENWKPTNRKPAAKTQSAAAKKSPAKKSPAKKSPAKKRATSTSRRATTRSKRPARPRR